MDWLTEPFAFEFMQRAVVGGILAVLTTSLVGTWVVLRGMAFIGDALAHGVLPGIAVAFLLDGSLMVGAVLSAMVMIGLIALVRRSTRLSEDTAIGLLFVGMLALGVIIISRSGSFAVDLVAILFGDILGTSNRDLAVQAGAAALAMVGVALFYRPLLALAFNPQKARVLGMRPDLAHLVMMGLVMVAVVSSFQTVGALLVFGLLLAPPATASLVARRVPVMMGVSALAGSVAVVAGLLLSYHLDIAAGAAVAGIAVASFFATLVAKTIADRARIR